MLQAARWKCRSQKIAKNSPSWHHRTTLLGYIFTAEARIDNRKKKLVKQQYLSHTSLQYRENFGPLAAKIGSVVWGTLVNCHWFHFFAALMHGTLVVGVSQTLRR